MSVPFGRHDPRVQLDSDAVLERELGSLLRAARNEQLWILFLDESHRILEPIMTMDEPAADPRELCATHDLGVISFAEVYAHRVNFVARDVGARSLVSVRERCGSEKFTSRDIEWARVLAHEFAAIGTVPLRAQFVLHDDGVRFLSLDDCA